MSNEHMLNFCRSLQRSNRDYRKERRWRRVYVQGPFSNTYLCKITYIMIISSLLCVCASEHTFV